MRGVYTCLQQEERVRGSNEHRQCREAIKPKRKSLDTDTFLATLSRVLFNYEAIGIGCGSPR